MNEGIIILLAGVILLFLIGMISIITVVVRMAKEHDRIKSMSGTYNWEWKKRK